MKSRSLLIALALAATTGLAAGQTNLLSVTITPNPAPVNTPVTVTASDLTNLMLHNPGGSVLGGVYDAPNGNLLTAFPGILLPQPIPTCASGGNRTQTWTPTQGPGTYWISIPVSSGPFGPLMTEWFCITLEDPAAPAPALSATTPAMIGQPFVMSIANAEPTALYVVALSSTTNVAPAAAAGICLDFDPLFNLSLQGLPGVFVNFVGGTDAAGTAGGITINFPNSPILSCFTAHAQAGILGVAAPAFTNDLIFTVQ